MTAAIIAGFVFAQNFEATYRGSATPTLESNLKIKRVCPPPSVLSTVAVRIDRVSTARIGLASKGLKASGFCAVELWFKADSKPTIYVAPVNPGTAWPKSIKLQNGVLYAYSGKLTDLRPAGTWSLNGRELSWTFKNKPVGQPVAAFVRWLPLNVAKRDVAELWQSCSTLALFPPTERISGFFLH